MFQDLSRRSIETGFWGIWDAAQIASLLESLITCIHNYSHTQILSAQQLGTLASLQQLGTLASQQQFGTLATNP